MNGITGFDFEDLLTEPNSARVTVGVYSPVDAQRARTRLEQAGIRCYLPNASVFGTIFGLPNSTGGIEVQVRRQDLLRALDVLRGLG